MVAQKTFEKRNEINGNHKLFFLNCLKNLCKDKTQQKSKYQPQKQKDQILYLVIKEYNELTENEYKFKQEFRTVIHKEQAQIIRHKRTTLSKAGVRNRKSNFSKDFKIQI